MTTNVIQTHHHTHSIVWWNAHDVHIDDKALRASLEQARSGLGSLVRTPAAAHSAMRKAMSRRQHGLASAWSWEEVGVDGDDLVVALAESSGDAAARSWSASVRLTIAVSKSGSTVTSRAASNDDEAAALGALLERYALERSELTQGDVRTIALRCLLDKDKGCGVRIKDSGSIYLLSAPHDQIVDDIKSAFAPAGLHLRTMPVYAESIAQLQGDVRAGLLGEVDEVKAAIAKSTAMVDGGANVRAATLAARFAELEELRKKAQLFRLVLAGELDAVEAAINAAREAAQAVTDRLGGKQ